MPSLAPAVGSGLGRALMARARPLRPATLCVCVAHATRYARPLQLPRASPFSTSGTSGTSGTRAASTDRADKHARDRGLRTDRTDRPDPETPTTTTTTTTKPDTVPSAAAVLAAKRKPRSAGAKNSLRRVAALAQQQPTAAEGGTALADEPEAAATSSEPKKRSTRRDAGLSAEQTELSADLSASGSSVISAVCLAESFDMGRCMAILEAQGFALDPDGSGFESHEVVHARRAAGSADGTSRVVDVFVFESGTIVGWGLPADDVDRLATGHLVAAAADPFVALRETETLDFRRDATRDASTMRGDVVVLGTRSEEADGDRLATTRAQIAFSSGLARSTKLAVLERSFTDYFESTRRIPELLAGRATDTHRDKRKGKGNGKVLRHLSQKFVLQKTGELLSLRAQLNHYRELTDALPDIFWDARAELGLESYYEQVGRALDVGVRIKTLNQKMDYAQEIATVLREISSERHGTRLEWIIIVLIAVEVVFELRRVYLDWQEASRTD